MKRLPVVAVCSCAGSVFNQTGCEMSQSLTVKIRDLYRRRGNLLYWTIFALLIGGWFGWYFIYKPSLITVSRRADLDLILNRKVMMTKKPGARPRNNNRLDSLLVLDVSGSMQGNDPDKLALTGTRLLADLLEPKDRMGVCYFNHGIARQFNIIPLGPDQAGQKKRIKATTKIKYDGGTAIMTALRRALFTMQKVNAGRKAVVFFTDANASGKFNTRAVFARNDIRLLPVGFGPSVNQKIFKTMSYEPFLTVQKPQDLLSTFAKIFSRISDSVPRTLSAIDGKYSFKFNDQIDGFNLVVLQDRSAPVKVSLYDAQGKQVTKGTKGLYLGRDPRYLVVKAGKALLPRFNSSSGYTASAVFSPPPKQVLLIPRYDFWLRVNLGKFNINKKQGTITSARLLDSRGKVVNPAGLKMEAVMEGPVGRKTWPLKPHATSSGVFHGKIPFGVQGNYNFFVRAITSGFKKQSRRFQFGYREKFYYKLAQEAGNWGKIKKGKTLALRIRPRQTQYLNAAGEQFSLRLNWKRAPSKLTLSKNKIQVYPALTNETLVRTKAGFPFLMPGTTVGSNYGHLEMTHPTAGKQQVPLSLTVTDLTLLEKLWPLLVTFVVLGTALYLFFRLIRYVPFDPRLSVFEFSDGMLMAKRIVHPGNRWLFGKPVLKFSDGSYLTPGESGKGVFFFQKKHTEEEGRLQDELLEVLSGRQEAEAQNPGKQRQYDRKPYLADSNYVLDGAKLVMLARGNRRRYNEMLQKMENRMERYVELQGRDYSERPELLN